MNLQNFEGLGVAVVTPFDIDGNIDFNSLKKIIRHQIDGGVDYLVIHGSTGEAATLTAQERRDSLDFIIEYVKGSVPIVVGIGNNSTLDTMNTIKDFDFTGVDGLLIASPSYNKPSQEGIYQHFKAIAKITSLPIILYNVPGRTASNMTATTSIRLAQDFKNIVAIKEASGDINQVIDILKDKPEDFLVLSGDDPLLIAMAAYGAKGLISVMGNAYPNEIKALTRTAIEGDFSQAKTIQFELLNMTKLAFAEGNPAGIKEILSQMNLCDSYIRLPLTEVSEDLKNEINKERTLVNNWLANAVHH